ncbi:MAG: hypothetical protein RL607_166 [Bacteroidota bacterium]|jgi:hypothetical protein
MIQKRGESCSNQNLQLRCSFLLYLKLGLFHDPEKGGKLLESKPAATQRLFIVLKLDYFMIQSRGKLLESKPTVTLQFFIVFKTWIIS